MATTSPEMKNAVKGQPEAPKSFVPTPERVSQYLERSTDKVAAQLSSVDGRKEVYQDLLQHEDDLRKMDPSFNAADLQRELDLVGQTLEQKQKFMKDMQSPEKKNMFRRAFDRVRSFAKSHPVVTTLLALAAVGATVAGFVYLSGSLSTLAATAAGKTILEFLGTTPATAPGAMPGLAPTLGSPL